MSPVDEQSLRLERNEIIGEVNHAGRPGPDGAMFSAQKATFGQ